MGVVTYVVDNNTVEYTNNGAAYTHISMVYSYLGEAMYHTDGELTMM